MAMDSILVWPIAAVFCVSWIISFLETAEFYWQYACVLDLLSVV